MERPRTKEDEDDGSLGSAVYSRSGYLGGGWKRGGVLGARGCSAGCWVSLSANVLIDVMMMYFTMFFVMCLSSVTCSDRN